MNGKDTHNRKYLQAPLPEPEVPADAAWAEMNNMLGGTGSHAPQDPGLTSKIWKPLLSLKGLLIAASVAVVSVAIAFIFFPFQSKKAGLDKKEQVSVDANDSVNAISALDACSDSSQRIQPIGEPETGSTTKVNAERERDNPSELDSARETNNVAEASAKPKARIAGSEKPRPSLRTDRTGNALVTEPVRRSHAGNARVRTTGAILSRNISPDAAAITNTRNSALTSNNPQHFPFTRPENKLVTLKSLSNLAPRPGRFTGSTANLATFIKKPVQQAVQPSPKRSKSVFTDVHFGPEWHLNRAFKSNDYLFTGADSVTRPARLAIPGVFVSKSWNWHTATFIFHPAHSYFGDQERVAQRIDRVRVTDSLFHTISRNTKFIKAFGINFSVQYQYQAAGWLSLAGGASYARYSSALFRRENVYSTGSSEPGSHLTVKSKEALQSYLRPQQWNIRAGVIFHAPGVLNNRLQVAWMVIMPVSSLSLSGFKSVKSPNMQLSLRFLVK